MAETSNQIQLCALIESWARAIREGDVDGVLAHHADDIVMFDVPLPLRSKSISAYRKTLELFFSFQNKGGFDLGELRIRASDSIAFCHSLVRFGNEAEPNVRLTMAFRKIQGRWLIAHEHHSSPVAFPATTRHEVGADEWLRSNMTPIN